MKRLATVAIASALALAAGAASADPPNPKGGPPPPHHDKAGGQKAPPKGPGGPGGGGSGSGGPGGNHGSGQTFQTQGGPGGSGNGGGPNHHDNGSLSTYRSQGGGGGGGGAGFQGHVTVGVGGHVAPGFMPGNHELRDRDQGRVWYNARVFPQVFHAGQRYHYRPYIFPSGWYFRAWLYGDYLPDGWYGPDYYLDWSYFDLPPPPIGCEWVREGNDALLVDVWTGEVLSVSHDMFW